MHLLEEESFSARFADPCILVIFGATGDLCARKLIPALYNLSLEGKLPPQFACVGFARREKTDGQFRQEMKEATGRFSRSKIEENGWDNFSRNLFYYQAEFHEKESFHKLKALLEERHSQS